MTGGYITRDDGQSWQMFNLRGGIDVLAFDPADPHVIYAGNAALWRSSDSGRTWQMLFPSPARNTIEHQLGDHSDYSLTSSDPAYPGGDISAIAIVPGSWRSGQGTRSIFILPSSRGASLPSLFPRQTAASPGAGSPPCLNTSCSSPRRVPAWSPSPGPLPGASLPMAAPPNWALSPAASGRPARRTPATQSGFTPPARTERSTSLRTPESTGTKSHPRSDNPPAALKPSLPAIAIRRLPTQVSGAFNSARESRTCITASPKPPTAATPGRSSSRNRTILPPTSAEAGSSNAPARETATSGSTRPTALA